MMKSSLFTHLFKDLPGSWIVRPFADVIDFQEGPGILAKDFHESGTPLIRLRHIETSIVNLAGCNFLDPELLISA